MNNVKNTIRSQKGMTLIELLAVVVILAILALIAIPSIGGLIDNTKKDAMVANAQQMVSSARLALATDPDIVDWTASKVGEEGTISLEKLSNGNYIENLNDPDTNAAYTKENMKASYVKVEKEADATVGGTGADKDTIAKYGVLKVTKVKLVGEDRSITDVAANELKRSSVKKN